MFVCRLLCVSFELCCLVYVIPFCLSVCLFLFFLWLALVLRFSLLYPFVFSSLVFSSVAFCRLCCFRLLDFRLLVSVSILVQILFSLDCLFGILLFRSIAKSVTNHTVKQQGTV